MTEPFRYCRTGRTPQAAAILAAIYAATAWLAFGLEAAPWIIGLIGVATLPALWDFSANRQSGLTLDDHDLAWYSAGRKGSVPIADIAKVRFDTRWDFTVRVTLALHSGERVRLPMECTTPHRALETAMIQRGLTTVRHHFRTF